MKLPSDLSSLETLELPSDLLSFEPDLETFELPSDLLSFEPDFDLETLELPSDLLSFEQDFDLGTLELPSDLLSFEPDVAVGKPQKRKFNSLPSELPCEKRAAGGQLARALVDFLVDVSQRLQHVEDMELTTAEGCVNLLDKFHVRGRFVRYLALRRLLPCQDGPGPLDFIGWGAMPWAARLGPTKSKRPKTSRTASSGTESAVTWQAGQQDKTCDMYFCFYRGFLCQGALVLPLSKRSEGGLEIQIYSYRMVSPHLSTVFKGG